ncbi:MAG TPA: type II toxin-antitoxin system RelE/ParE family toxin [Rudaea sp.]|jgi:plasmid stabilization system protein ParE|nr:type II toxin-antitoxin system RelE/ParE family toxin [Rudaea sp.]
MKVIVRSEARQELLAAQIWFETKSPGLGFEFARSIAAAVESVVRNPIAYTEIELGRRRILLRRFPYALIYRIRNDELLLVAVFHQRRQPGAWRDRVTSSDT